MGRKMVLQKRKEITCGKTPNLSGWQRFSGTWVPVAQSVGNLCVCGCWLPVEGMDAA